MLRRTWVTLLASLTVTAAMVVPTELAAAPGTSPDGRVLVVTANLREAYPDGGDLADDGDMRLFVRTLLSKVPFKPDVLLVQEVSRQSSKFVARFLSQKTGKRYIAAVKPDDVVVQEQTRTVHTETAIILNTSTMAKKSKGGYIRLTYDRDDAEAGRRVNVRRQAHILAAERSSGTKIALMNVRFENRVEIRDSADWSYRTKWTNRIAKFMNRRYSSTKDEMRAIGGDFNVPRCRSGNTPCRKARWYKLITGDHFDYVDAFNRPGLFTGVDIIFARQRSPDAGLDNGNRPYSDHRFRWAVVVP